MANSVKPRRAVYGSGFVLSLAFILSLLGGHMLLLRPGGAAVVIALLAACSGGGGTSQAPRVPTKSQGAQQRTAAQTEATATRPVIPAQLPNPILLGNFASVNPTLQLNGTVTAVNTGDVIVVGVTNGGAASDIRTNMTTVLRSSNGTADGLGVYRKAAVAGLMKISMNARVAEMITFTVIEVPNTVMGRKGFTATNSALMLTPSLTPVTAGDLALAFFGDTNSQTGPVPQGTVGSGWTELASILGPAGTNTDVGTEVQYLQLAGTPATQGSYSLPVALAGNAALVLFAPTPTPTPTPTATPSPTPTPTNTPSPTPTPTPTPASPWITVSTGTNAVDIIAGADGNMWFTDPSGNIGKVSPLRAVTNYPVPTLGSKPTAITRGNGTMLWFTESTQGIASIDTSGHVVEYPDPTGARWFHNWITLGPDGNLWVTVDDQITTAPAVEKISQTGQYLATYFLTSDRASGAYITPGPDNNLWISEQTGQLVRMDTMGNMTKIGHIVTTERQVVTGPDGNLWVAGFLNGIDVIAKATTAGIITKFKVPACAPNHCGMTGIAVGPDNNLWWTDSVSRVIGYTTTVGASTILFPPFSGAPQYITAGPDGNVWFTDGGAIYIYALH